MGDGTEEEAEDALFAALSAKAGRYVLSDKLKQILVPYLFRELGLLTLSDVESLGAKGFEEALDEAVDGTKFPAPLRSGALEWFAHLGDDPGPRLRSAKEKQQPKRVVATRKARIAPIEPDTDDDDDVMSIVSGLGGLGSDKQSKDEDKMRLSGDEIQALHRSVFKGRVVSASECEGVPYGQDCQYTEWARLLKKSGIVTFLKHLDDKDYGKAKEKLITLIREYNEKGFTQEVTILTGAMTSAEEMFVGDEKGLCSYWEAYWKLYQGRAFPKEIDLRLVVKSLKVGQSQGWQNPSLRSKMRSRNWVSSRPSSRGSTRKSTRSSKRPTPMLASCPTCAPAAAGAVRASVPRASARIARRRGISTGTARRDWQTRRPRHRERETNPMTSRPKERRSDGDGPVPLVR